METGTLGAGHITSAGGNREMSAGAHLAVLGPGPQPLEWICPHLGWVFPPRKLNSGTPSQASPVAYLLDVSRSCQVDRRY